MPWKSQFAVAQISVSKPSLSSSVIEGSKRVHERGNLSDATQIYYRHRGPRISRSASISGRLSRSKFQTWRRNDKNSTSSRSLHPAGGDSTRSARQHVSSRPGEACSARQQDPHAKASDQRSGDGSFPRISSRQLKRPRQRVRETPRLRVCSSRAAKSLSRCTTGKRIRSPISRARVDLPLPAFPRITIRCVIGMAFVKARRSKARQQTDDVVEFFEVVSAVAGVGVRFG